MRTIIIAILVSLFCVGCAKIYENVRIERIERPKIEIDSIAPPQWDTIPSPPDIPNVGG